MGFSSKLIFGGITAGAALAYYVQRRRARTGESYLDIVRQLPGDARRWASDSRQRATLALQEGKTAARDREAELSAQLTATSPQPASGG